MRTIKIQQDRKKTQIEEKVYNTTGISKKPGESIEHVHQLYKKHGEHLKEMDRKRYEKSKDSIDRKKKGLAGKIANLPGKPGELSEWIAKNRFDVYDVHEVIHTNKGRKVLLNCPIKTKVKRQSKEKIGSKVRSSNLRENFNKGKEGSQEKRKNTKKKIISVKDNLMNEIDEGKKKKNINKAGGKDGITVRIKDEKNQIVYTNFSGKKWEFSSEKKHKKEQQELQTQKDHNKENVNMGFENRVKLGEEDKAWKKNIEVLRNSEESIENSGGIDSEEIDFDQELELKEKERESIELSQHHNKVYNTSSFLEEYFVSKVKKLGFKATAEGMNSSKILAQVLSDQGNQRISLLYENIKKEADFESVLVMKENPKLQSTKQKRATN